MRESPAYIPAHRHSAGSGGPVRLWLPRVPLASQSCRSAETVRKNGASQDTEANKPDEP